MAYVSSMILFQIEKYSSGSRYAERKFLHSEAFER